MDHGKELIVEPGSKVDLGQIDPADTGKYASHEKADPETLEATARMDRLQYLLYANAGPSLLIVLQALDAGGKDGVIRHLFSGMNPQGLTVTGFQEPSKVELAHDFLWRAHQRAPARGEIAIFNRSHYEDVLIVRVHNLVPPAVWSKRYELINGFETVLAENGTRILKFYLHISPDEQLARFKERLDDPARRWKISESDYTERKFWPQYREAYEEAIECTSTKHAPWYIIPSNHKWYRNLVISQIIADAMDEMGLKPPPARIDLAEIRRKYHEAEREASEPKAKQPQEKQPRKA